MRWRDAGSGKWTTKHFPKAEKKAALAWAEGRRWEERQWGADAVSAAERVLLAQLREALARAGRTLAEVAPALLAAAGAKRVGPKRPGEALEAFLEHCRGRNLRPATVASYEKAGRRFLLVEGEELPSLGALTRDRLRGHILANHRSEVMRQHARRHLLAWLRWCADQGWLDAAAVEGITWRAARTDARAIPSLGAEEARGLLRALPEKWRAACALGLFAGIRPEELRRLRWADVDGARQIIRIPATASKIREARVLRDLPGNLWAWVEAHPGERTGAVVPITMRNWLAHLRKARLAAGVRNWGPDILRKSFASMGFHLPGGPTQAAEIMGHLRGLQVYLRHYRDLRTAAEAREYFGIRPGECGASR